MNNNISCYFCFKKLITKNLDETIEDTFEYKTLYKHYPHLTQSIKLTREKNKLLQKLKSLKGSARLRERRKVFAIDVSLRRTNMLKRLFGENKPETTYKIRFTLERLRKTTKESVSALSRRGQDYLHGILPPLIFDLKSLDMIEKGTVLKKWIQKTRDGY
jgi:hypothetical protein